MKGCVHKLDWIIELPVSIPWQHFLTACIKPDRFKPDESQYLKGEEDMGPTPNKELFATDSIFFGNTYVFNFTLVYAHICLNIKQEFFIFL